MKAWLEIECGELVGNDVRERGLAYATKIHAGFSTHRTFAEYNSPTYYGINFFALGLWQNFSQDLGQMGEEINRALWSDLSRYYHAGMKNLCGPWSRAYGMDMQHYVAAVGLWIWAATNREVAPFPATTRQLMHAHDFCLGPLAALSAVAIPDSVRPNFFRFEDTRQISQQIATAPARQADAYLAPDIMIGLESSARSFRGGDQYHPLTIHWLGPAGVAWCRLRFKGRVEGDLDGTRVELKLRPDEDVRSASIEFHRNIQLSENIVESDNLSMRLATRCKLSVEGSSLIIDLPDDADDEQVVSISCRVSK